jgi:hypothetical protein
MNIADIVKDYYESDDFKGRYLEALYESFVDRENEIIDNILRLFNVSNYETEKYLSNHKQIDRKQAKLIYDFIYDDLESFVSGFRGHYVGYTSLDSVSFGEQEEQLEGLYNHKTDKEYNMSYLKKVFSKDFYVSDNGYAYYDLSDSGLHVELISNELNDFLKTI